MLTKQGQETEWQNWKDKNKDPYGAACVVYADRWAVLMEKEITDETDLVKFMQDRARSLSHEADTDGITGFMYGCAVSMLSQCWKYGESLRRWHNKDTQIGTEGEKANTDGGVLNPALLTISTPE